VPLKGYGWQATYLPAEGVSRSSAGAQGDGATCGMFISSN